jgi:hypothetical protein
MVHKINAEKNIRYKVQHIVNFTSVKVVFELCISMDFWNIPTETKCQVTIGINQRVLND